MTISTYYMTVQESKMITPNVRHIALRVADPDHFDFIPGQFITVHFEAEEKHFKRSYSIATIPGTSPLIEIAASYFPGGPGTEYLFHLQPGERIEVSGPYGRLTLREENPARYILVATGTGVTPYRSMLPELAARFQNSALQVVVLLGVKNRDELLYGEDFIEFAKKWPQFDFRAHYSRAKSDELKFPWEYTGYVQHAFETLNLNPQQDIVYLCGNPAMIDDAFAHLKQAGFDTAQVRREKYVSSPAK